MIIYILQKDFTTETAKGIDELNALANKGFKFIKAVDKKESEVEKQEEINEQSIDDLTCMRCGKAYKSEKSYLKHIESCKA